MVALRELIFHPLTAFWQKELWKALFDTRLHDWRPSRLFFFPRGSCCLHWTVSFISNSGEFKLADVTGRSFEPSDGFTGGWRRFLSHWIYAGIVSTLLCSCRLLTWLDIKIPPILFKVWQWMCPFSCGCYWIAWKQDEVSGMVTTALMRMTMRMSHLAGPVAGLH